jgi:hypothetical protein
MGMETSLRHTGGITGLFEDFRDVASRDKGRGRTRKANRETWNVLKMGANGREKMEKAHEQRNVFDRRFPTKSLSWGETGRDFGLATRCSVDYSSIMPTVGEQLRKGREALDLELHDIVDMTKIQSDHLRALEEGNYSVFSAPVYIRGFVRTYATVPKLDTAKILEQLGKELADSGQVDPLLATPEKSLLDATMFHLSRFSRRLVWPAVGTAALALVVCVGYLFWTHHRGEDPTVGLGAGLYQVPTNSGETLPLPMIR